MKEKELPKKTKKASETGNLLSALLILVLLTIVGFFLVLHFSEPATKSFEMRKKDEKTIEIYGLKQEEVDKID